MKLQSNNNIVAIVNEKNGQLVSLRKNDLEYIHGGGKSSTDSSKQPEDSQGWKESIIPMFPIVSSSKDNIVLFKGQQYGLSQHGITRAIKPSVIELDGGIIEVTRNYKAGTEIDNSERHKKDPTNPLVMSLPFDFELNEVYRFSDDVLHLDDRLHNPGQNAFGFAKGKHPAFKVLGKPEDGEFQDKNGNLIVTLTNLMKECADGSARMLPNANYVRFVNGKHGVEFYSDMGNIMLWSPAGHMFCIEPITEKLPKGTLIDLTPGASYKGVLHSTETKRYATSIEVF